MNKETGSFQDNIRRVFIRFSLLPVGIIAALAIALFALLWTYFTAHFNEQDSKNVATSLSRTLNICSNMMTDVEKAVSDAGGKVESDRIFPILYKCTSDFGEIGDLTVLTADRDIAFSSREIVPDYLTDEVCSDWGVWHAIKAGAGTTVTVLYDKSLYVAKGIYTVDGLSYAIVYEVPKDVISRATGELNRYFAITDRNGWIYETNTDILRDSFGRIPDVFTSGAGYVKVGGRLMYTCRTDTGKGLLVITVNDISRSIRLLTILTGVIMIIFAAILVITLRSTANSSEQLTADIRKIENAFDAVSDGNFDVSLDIGSSTEFEAIGNDFNEMLQSLKDQITRNRELAENVAFSQVKQLESQFNPHFLFNTLDNIRFMAKIDANAADKMIISLSGLLRYSIKDSREEVTVREDLENLQSYLNILQIRFNKRFAYKMDVADDIMDCLIPKLMLQPLLENAVKYGFGSKEKLTVNIRGYQMQEKLIFVCEDDGAGIEEDKLAEIVAGLRSDTNPPVHYGLYNIHRRVKLLYKNNGDYGLDITSRKNEGTTVRIVLPKHFYEGK